ncbi:thiamine phosphate synthase [bacterium]|nr:thiamine phosphate synthase [bacterium]
MDDFGLYVILTQPHIPHEDVARICVDENIRILQLREKNISDREILILAEKIMRITSGTNTLFVMNNRLDLALAAGADGLHIGQDDLPVKTALRLMKPGMHLGLSTHTIDLARNAVRYNPDCIGFGPIFETSTKKDTNPVVGLDLLSQAVEISSIPIVAIGGINLNNLSSVLDAGAKNVAMISELVHTKDCAKRIKAVQKKILDY